MCVLGADAYASPDRGQPVAVNVVLAACMALPLIWRRRSPVWFLVVVNLLALPISNSVASDNDLFWVSTYVFVVPVWAVAVWSSAGPAITGLVFAARFNSGECLYWHARRHLDRRQSAVHRIAVVRGPRGALAAALGR